IPNVALAPPALTVREYGRAFTQKRSFMLLIHCATTLTSVVSTRLDASGGIWMVPGPRVLMRLCRTEWPRSCGTITRLAESPSVSLSVPLMMLAWVIGVLKRASQLAADGPPG